MSDIEKIGKGVVGTEVSIVTLIMSRFIFHSFQNVNLGLVFLYLCFYILEINIGSL